MSDLRQLRWDRHFLRLALEHSNMSKDPSTKVGAIIVGPDFDVRAAGFNGFPRGVLDAPERLSKREIKYKLIVHAELNTVLAAARSGISVYGCSIYVTARDAISSKLWGGPPCIRCTVALAQAGIIQIIGTPRNYTGSRWSEDDAFPGITELVMSEANPTIRYREVSLDEG